MDIKRIISFITAVMMSLSISCTAYAEEIEAIDATDSIAAIESMNVAFEGEESEDDISESINFDADSNKTQGQTALHGDEASQYSYNEYAGRLYNQWDGTWEDYISGPGCGFFAICNALYALNGSRLNPYDVRTYADSIGFLGWSSDNYGELLSPWPFFEEHFCPDYGDIYNFKLDYLYDGPEAIDCPEVRSLLASGSVAFVNVPGHYMAITGYNPANNTFHVIDSAENIGWGRDMVADSWQTPEKLKSGDTYVSFIAVFSCKNPMPSLEVKNLGDVFVAYIAEKQKWKYVTANFEENVDQYTHIYSPTASICDYQKWIFYRNPDNSYFIVNFATGEALDGYGGSAGAYTYTRFDDNDYQKWYIIGSDNNYQLRNKASGHNLDVNYGIPDDGVQLVVCAPHDGENQRFNILREENELFDHCSVVYDPSSQAFKVSAQVKDINAIQKVEVYAFTNYNGFDDEKSYNTSLVNGIYTCEIPISNHNYETGHYNIHIAAFDHSNNITRWRVESAPCKADTEKPELTNFDLKFDQSQNAFVFNCDAHDDTGLEVIRLAVWTDNNGQDDLKWYTKWYNNDYWLYGVEDDYSDIHYTATIPLKAHNNETGAYHFHIYAHDIAYNESFVCYSNAIYPVAAQRVEFKVKDIVQEQSSNLHAPAEYDHYNYMSNYGDYYLYSGLVVYPENSCFGSIDSIVSNNPDVCRINGSSEHDDFNGYYGPTAGTSTITLTTTTGLTATQKITITPKDVPVESISLDKSSVSLLIGESETITASITPADANDKTVTWTSDDEGVVSVSDGVITANGLGTATITATTSNGKTAICTVTVNPIAVASIMLNKTSVTLNEGETLTLTATIGPSIATNKTVTWTSDNPAVATVTNGKVTAVSAGTTNIIARAEGKSATCTVTVTSTAIEVTSVTLDKTELTLEVGKNDTLTATVAPENADNKAITWETSDDSVAMVSSRGRVAAISVGTATITATSSNGKTASCIVTVTEPVVEVTSVVLSKTSVTLESGKSEILTATVYPDNAADKAVTWETSDDSIVMVSSSGRIVGISEGSATITATSSNGKTATCTVTVTNTLTSAPAKPTVVIKTAFGGRTVQLNCADTDAEIYYSFGSSNITTSCQHVKAGETIFLNEPMTGNNAAMYFKAYKNGKWSELGKWGVLNVQIAKPLIVQSGKKSDNNFKIYTQTKDSYIVYTLDGSTPEINEGTNRPAVKNGRLVWSTSTVINVPKGKTIKAIAVRCGLVTSDVMEYTNK